MPRKSSQDPPSDGSDAARKQAASRHERAGGGLSGVAIRRPVFTGMMMMALVVLGVFSFRRLPIDLFPEIDIPVVAIQTIYPGASPETIEREVTQRLEEAFNPVQGVDRITSTTLEGASQIIIEFELDRDVDQAAQDVRDKIAAVRRELPADIEEPLVLKFDIAAQPIISLTLSSSTMPIADLTALADETVRRRLEGVTGVGQAQIAGGQEREIRVNLVPDWMQARGVSVTDVMGALRMQNMEVPAGRLERDNTEQLVRVTGRIEDPAGFGAIIVANRNGTAIRLRDVARIEVGTEEERSVALVNDRRAVAVDVLKVSGANTVAVADGVLEAVSELQEMLPEGTTLEVIRDNSIVIRQSVHDVIVELLLGALLTVIIVMVFLNDWKATVITSFALPVSVISAFILMNGLGFTLNVISLMALSLSIGILIDDAIVVIENIVRHRELGQDHFTAAGMGTREIFLAVLATTLSIVAVFVPVAFMGGIVGRFFYQFGLTVAWAVLVSLFVSFTLTPMMSAWWGVNPHDPARGGNLLTRGIGRFNAWFDRVGTRYRDVIGWALDHRKSTLAIATASFIGAFMMLPFIGGAFMPSSDDSEFAVTFETPEGSSLAYTRSKAEEVGALLRGMPEVDYTYTTVGAGALGTVTVGEVFVKLVPTGERDLSQEELMPVARQALLQVFGVETQVLVSGGFGGAQAPIQVQLRGPDVLELQRIADEIAGRMRGIPGLADVRTSLGDPRPEFRIDVNREEAAELGLDIGLIAATVRPVLAGQDATRWEDPSGEERNVVVQVAPEERTSVEDLATLPISTSLRGPGGGALTVPLGQIARIELGEAPAQIDRQNLERIASISATNTPEISVSEASTTIAGAIADLDLPEGYSVGFGGETEALEETVVYVIEAILLAIILIFLILASQFESLTQPLAIMLSLPLSLIGVLIALLLTGDTLNMMSLIGVILLMGLVTKNAILLVDNANERRSAGKDRRTALIEAGHVRLRPIIMTTMAMIFGMLPIALALGEGGGFRAPMARAVIGGLITSTMLTLIVVPVAYTYLDSIGEWVRHRLVGSEREHEIEEERAMSGLAAESRWGEQPL
jgi:HAE1 family hydrophobic/amphiphilic exporter-1